MSAAGQAELHLATRTHLTPELFVGGRPADRGAWSSDPRFLGWPAELQRVHATMTEASARLATGLDVLLDENEGSVQAALGAKGMRSLGLELVARITHHHAYEDRTVLPCFLQQFPELSGAIDLLERDHDVLHDSLEAARLSFIALAPEKISKRDVDAALVRAGELRRILARHTYDEEDLLISAVL